MTDPKTAATRAMQILRESGVSDHHIALNMILVGAELLISKPNSLDVLNSLERLALHFERLRRDAEEDLRKGLN